MTEYIGNAAYILWVTSTGTTTISTDFRQFTINDEVGEVDKSAGADTRRTYIKTLKDGSVNSTFLHDGGTLNWIELAPGKEGTLTWGEIGTANGAPKHTQPAFIRSANMDQPYDGLEIFSPIWRPTADRTDGTWADGA